MLLIAGAFKHFKTISVMILKHKIKNICVYDGVDNLQWNGGRVNILHSAKFSGMQLKFYNSKNIGVYFTFSNSVIDLKDPAANEILKKINNPINGCIIVNDNLRKYIRDKFPNLKLIFSCTGFKDSKIDIPMLKDLESKYDLICPRYEWIFDPKFYTAIDPKKYEIMLNDTCIFKCPKWHQHFEAINSANRNPLLTIEQAQKISECWIKGFDPNIESKSPLKTGMDLNKESLIKSKEIGYCNFKLSGRELSKEDFLDDLIKYTGLISAV